MYFITKAWQSIKSIVAISGITGSALAIIYGILPGGGSVFIIGGSLCLANSLFNIIEIGKVNIDIKRQIKSLKSSIKQFNTQNKILENSVRVGMQNNIVQKRENNRLKDLVDRSEKHIDKLESIQAKILAAKDSLTKEVNSLHAENQTLSVSLENLKKLRDKYAVENQALSLSVSQLREQVKIVEELKIEIADENQKLSENNQLLEAQISQQAEIIVDSKRLIQNLALFGDRYTAFGETLGTDIQKLESTTSDIGITATVLKKLTTGLKDQSFDKLDLDGDGVITREEFNSGIQDL